MYQTGSSSWSRTNMTTFPWWYKVLNSCLLREATPGVENNSALLRHLCYEHMLRGEHTVRQQDVRIGVYNVRFFPSKTPRCSNWYICARIMKKNYLNNLFEFSFDYCKLHFTRTLFEFENRRVANSYIIPVSNTTGETCLERNLEMLSGSDVERGNRREDREHWRSLC